MLTSRGLGTVLGDLAEMGYDARWGVFSAGDVGARHERERLWIVANSDKIGLKKLGKQFCKSEEPGSSWEKAVGNPADSPRNTNDMATRVDRLAATGNGQVPAVVRLAWETLA